MRNRVRNIDVVLIHWAKYLPVHTGIGSDIWIKCVVVLYGCRGGIVGIGLVASPVVSRLSLSCIFIWTSGCCWEVFSATLDSLPEEVVLFEGDIAHPCWVVTTIGAAVTGEIGKEVIIRRRLPWFVFVLGVDSTLIIWAIYAIGIPLWV